MIPITITKARRQLGKVGDQVAKTPGLRIVVRRPNDSGGWFAIVSLEDLAVLEKLEGAVERFWRSARKEAKDG